MEDLKILINNNAIYLIITFILAYLGIKITKKIVKLFISIGFFLYTLLKIAIRANLIN
jgi:hypothetical protein